MKNNTIYLSLTIVALVFTTACTNIQKKKELEKNIASIGLTKGELALCGKADFGTTDFGLTCVKEVREQFELAVALLHSFEYEEAEKAFAKVIDADPQCAIAYWGVAMSNYHPLWMPPSEKELEKSAKAIEVAQTLPTKTEREAKYIEAIGAYYKDWNQLDHKTRAKLYVESMEKLHAENPDDKEAAIFYALALNSVADPKDKTFANQKKAGEILNNIFPGEPDHPGVAHYIIHSYDYPELAELGLSSARKYAEIAPSSAHAQHMPSHIFIRLGLWEEAIQSNLKSAEAATCYSENLQKQGHWFNELHALDYIMYAYMQSSQLEKAKELLDYTKGIREVYPVHNVASFYALAAIPSRYPLELRNWEEAVNVQRISGNFSWEDYPWESSIVSFAHALGFAHKKDLEKAKGALEELKANHQKLVEKQDSYKAGQVEIQMKASEAWIAYAEGNGEKAIKLMSDAADMEDATAKHPVTPGEVLPARELLGDLYASQGKYDKALNAYQLSLEKHKNRFNSLYGAGIAAEKTGATDKAGEYFAQLLAITTNATGTRPELEYAKKFIEKHEGKQLSMK